MRLRLCATFPVPVVDEVRRNPDLARAWVLQTFCDYLDQGDTEDEGLELLIPYFEHCGMIDALENLLREIAPSWSLEELVLPHYALPGGGYDLERVALDYATQPKMRKAIAQHEEKIERRRNLQAESKRRRREARRGEEAGRQVALATSRRQDRG